MGEWAEHVLLRGSDNTTSCRVKNNCHVIWERINHAANWIKARCSEGQVIYVIIILIQKKRWVRSMTKLCTWIMPGFPPSVSPPFNKEEKQDIQLNLFGLWDFLLNLLSYCYDAVLFNLFIFHWRMKKEWIVTFTLSEHFQLSEKRWERKCVIWSVWYDVFSTFSWLTDKGKRQNSYLYVVWSFPVDCIKMGQISQCDQVLFNLSILYWQRKIEGIGTFTLSAHSQLSE